EPPRPLRPDGPAAAAPAGHGPVPRRDDVEHGSPPGSCRPRRPAVGAPALRPVAGLLPEQAGQPAVHRRALTPAAGGGGDDLGPGRPPRRLPYRPRPE